MEIINAQIKTGQSSKNGTKGVPFEVFRDNGT